MENIDYLIDQLKESDRFEKIDNSTVSELEKYETLYSIREDGFSQRILNYIFTLRIGKKLNKKTILMWDTNKHGSAAIQHELRDDDIEIYQNIPTIKFNSNFERFYKLGRGGAIKKNIFYNSKIRYFENENLRDVITEISNLYKNLELNEDIQKIVNNLQVYDYGIHSRTGDINLTEVNLGQGSWRWHTRDRLSLNKCFPNEAYIKIVNDLKPSNIYVSSSSEKFVNNLSALDNVKTLEKDLGKHKFTGTKKFILDVHALSKCKKLICSFSSGSTLMAIFLRINSTNITPVDYLKIEGIYDELSNVIKEQFVKLNSPKFMFKKIILIYLGRFYGTFLQRFFARLLRKKIKFKS